MLHAGAGYILWLAWAVLAGKPKRKNAASPDSAATGMPLQLINFKVNIYGLTALPTFTLPPQIKNPP